MKGQGFVEPWLSFSLEAFCDRRPFSGIGGRFGTVNGPDIRDELMGYIVYEAMDWLSNELIES